MKKGLRVLSLAALFGVLATGFTGCGKNEETKEVEVQEVTLDAAESETAFANVLSTLNSTLNSTQLGLKATVTVDLSKFRTLLEADTAQGMTENIPEGLLGEDYKMVATGLVGSNANKDYYLKATLNNDERKAYTIYLVAQKEGTTVTGYTAYLSSPDGKIQENADEVATYLGMLGSEQFRSMVTFDGLKQQLESLKTMLPSAADLTEVSSEEEDSTPTEDNNEGVDETEDNELTEEKVDIGAEIIKGIVSVAGITKEGVTTALDMTKKGEVTALKASLSIEMNDLVAIAGMTEDQLSNFNPANAPKVTVSLNAKLEVENNTLKGINVELKYGNSTVVSVVVVPENVTFTIPSAQQLEEYLVVEENTEDQNYDDPDQE